MIGRRQGPLPIRGTLMDLQIALGVDGQPAVSSTYACALKKASGMTGRKFDVQAVVSWARKNPSFKVTDVYPKKNHQPTA